MCCLLVVCLTASPVHAQTGGENDSEGTNPDRVVLNGGGFGHAVGLSQFGAYGRALAGHAYDEILAFYYDDTTLGPITGFKEFGPASIPETIDFDVGVRQLIAISTPLDELGPEEWELSVEVAGEVIGVSSLPLTTHYDGARWHAEYTDKPTGVTTDVCDNDSRCENTVLEVAQTVGTRAVVEEFEDGPNLGSYFGGRYSLWPASVAVDGVQPDDCGAGLQFCITHSRARPIPEGGLNVLIGVRESVAVATPLDELGPGEWELTVEAGGQTVGVSSLPLTAHYDGARWHAEYTDKSTGVTTDLCDNDSRCLNTALEIVQTVGTRAVVEEFEDGPNLGSYAKARYLLHPASVSLNGSTPDRCGTGRKFCVVVAHLDMEKYLYGLQEVPTHWPMEALKAQAVAARSYAAATIVERAASRDWFDEPFNLYDSTSDQVFTGWARESGCAWHSWCDAVDATAGEVVIYQAEIEPAEDTPQNDDSGTASRSEPRIAQTFYSSSNGGHTAKPTDIWSGGNDLPFLAPKPDPFDAAIDPETGRRHNPNADWTRSYSVSELMRWLNDYTARGEEPLNIRSLRGIDIEDAPLSRHVNFAKVTIHEEDRSITLLRDGEPYGAWLFYAILNGCRRSQGCHPPVSSQFSIEWPTGYEPEDDSEDTPEESLDESPEETPEPAPVIEFSDILPTDYFYEPVVWSVSEGLTSGVTEKTFEPFDQVNRAEFAEILWRFEGSPTPNNRTDFEDVAEDAPYRDAVALLSSQSYNVVNGTSPTTFSPDMPVTRAQASTFLWRFAGKPVEDVGTTFSDVGESYYYSDAVRWMLEHGITTGTSPTTFSPHNPLTRADVVTFVWRLAALPEAFSASLQAFLPPNMREQPNT